MATSAEGEKSAIVLNLDKGWSFTQLTGHDRNQPSNKGTEPGEWLPVDVPTGVHDELLKLSRIPDPFVGLNEHLIQWIGEESWAFQTKFSIPTSAHRLSHIDIVFEGLDTYATVSVDGRTILECVGWPALDPRGNTDRLSGRTICLFLTECPSRRRWVPPTARLSTRS